LPGNWKKLVSMKIRASLFLLACAAIATPALASRHNSTTLPIGSPQESASERPCQVVRSACEARGYHYPRHRKKEAVSLITDGKDLNKDCMTPLLEGGSVGGVSVPLSVLAECKALRAKKKKRQEEARRERQGK
jgi:hypothetical protein